MRFDKDTYRSLLDSIQDLYSSPKIQEEEDEEVVEEKDFDITKVGDKEVADMVIRYNQIVNNALRAKFASRTRRRSL